MQAINAIRIIGGVNKILLVLTSEDHPSYELHTQALKKIMAAQILLTEAVSLIAKKEPPNEPI